MSDPYDPVKLGRFLDASTSDGELDEFWGVCNVPRNQRALQRALSSYSAPASTLMTMNNVKTVGLLAFMTALLFFIVYALGGSFAMALIIAFGFNFFAYFFSDKMALRISRARPVTETEQPELYAIVRRLTTQIGMPTPSIYVID